MNNPNYKNSITNLSNSILSHFGVTPFHNSISEIDEKIKGKKKVIVFLFDGMGKVILEKHLEKDSFFRSHIIHNMMSTIPPTTVASTTSFLSGRFPIETGWLGWTLYFSSVNKNVNVFPNVDDETGEKIEGENLMQKEAPYKNICELINETNKKDIAQIIYGYPVDSKNKKVRHLKSFVKHSFEVADSKDESFTYAYWVEPDALMHGLGTMDKRVHKNILKIQKYVERYSNKYSDVATIVIADHGMKDVKFYDMHEHLDLLDCLLRPMSIEKRCPNFFIKEGREEEFASLFNKYYGEHYILMKTEEALAKGIFGDAPASETAKKFLGQFIALASDEFSIECPHEEGKKKYVFKGHHAGNTLDELEISVIGINLD